MSGILTYLLSEVWLERVAPQASLYLLLLFQLLRVLTPPPSFVGVAVAPLSVGQQSTSRDNDMPSSCVVGISQTRLTGTGMYADWIIKHYCH